MPRKARPFSHGSTHAPGGRDPIPGLSGGGDVSGPSSSVDGQVAVADGATGKLLRFLASTGILKLVSGVASAVTTWAGMGLSGDLPMGGSRVTGLGAATATDDAVTYGQVQGLLAGLDWQGSVKARQASPPGSPSAGDRYIVGTGPSGAWTGHGDAIAEYTGSAWAYTVPTKGCTVPDEALGRDWLFNGVAWVDFGSSIDHAATSNRGWTASGHSGTANTSATFDGAGAATLTPTGATPGAGVIAKGDGSGKLDAWVSSASSSTPGLAKLGGAGGSVAYEALAVTEITAAGSTNVAIPTAAISCLIEICGGGGQGGGGAKAAAGAQRTGGSGGTGGGYSRRVVSCAALRALGGTPQLAVTVGAGGSASGAGATTNSSTGANGANGAATTVSVNGTQIVTAPGGPGGTGGSISGSPASVNSTAGSTACTEQGGLGGRSQTSTGQLAGAATGHAGAGGGGGDPLGTTNTPTNGAPGGQGGSYLSATSTVGAGGVAAVGGTATAPTILEGGSGGGGGSANNGGNGYAGGAGTRGGGGGGGGASTNGAGNGGAGGAGGDGWARITFF